jgi:hypothetical protein
LNAAAIALQVGETGFAMQPQRENAAGRAHVCALQFKLTRVFSAVGGNDFSGSPRLVEPVWERIFPERCNFGEFSLALEVLIERLERQSDLPS